MLPTIELLITACLSAASGPTYCEDIRAQTMFVSVTQCQIFGQQALAEIMQAYPKRVVKRYVCEEVKKDREI